MIQGEDYPEFCSECRATVDFLGAVADFGPDTDDPEAPLMLAGDQGMLCGGSFCERSRDMGVLAGLSADTQLVRRKGPHEIITRVHVDPETGEPDGFEVVAPIELFVAAGTWDTHIKASEGWRRFLALPCGVAYVHVSAEEVEELAALL